MNNLDKDYQTLLQDILENGVKKEDRTGTGTISVFGRQIRHKMKDGFPLLTTKKMPFKTIVTELLWFLRGDTNIKFLVDNNCHIWDGDAYKNYKQYFENKYGNYITDRVSNEDGEYLIVNKNPLPKETILNTIYSKEEFINKIKTDDEFAKKWGELGPIYGKQWRSWKKPNHLTGPCEDEYTTDLGFISKEEYEIEKDFYVIDQIQNLINDLKTNPDSRRLMVNAWNVGELDQMVLPPCHYGFQVYTRELSLDERHQISMDRIGHSGVANRDNISWHETYNKTGIPTRAISLMWNQRSCDFPLGIPFNIASYGLLLMMIADEVNMVPEELIGNLGDCHIYLNQIEGCREQIKREPKKLPTVHVRDGIYCSSHYDVMLFGYEAHPSIKFPLSN